MTSANKLTIINLLNSNFSQEYLSELLGYNPGGNFYLQARGGMKRIREKADESSNGTGSSFKSFLGSAKSSKALRLALGERDSLKSSPFDLYLGGKIRDKIFDSSFFFKTVEKILLKHNKIKSRAQSAHFTDTAPECAGCGQHETVVHLFWECSKFNNCVSLCASVFGMTKEDLLGAFEGQKTLLALF